MSQALVVAALVAATVAGDSNYGYAKEPRLSLVDENRKAVVAGADATAWCPGTPWPAPAAGEGRRVVLVLRGEIYRSEATTYSKPGDSPKVAAPCSSEDWIEPQLATARHIVQGIIEPLEARGLAVDILAAPSNPRCAWKNHLYAILAGASRRRVIPIEREATNQGQGVRNALEALRQHAAAPDAPRYDYAMFWRFDGKPLRDPRIFERGAEKVLVDIIGHARLTEIAHPDHAYWFPWPALSCWSLLRRPRSIGSRRRRGDGAVCHRGSGSRRRGDDTDLSVEHRIGKAGRVAAATSRISAWSVGSGERVASPRGDTDLSGGSIGSGLSVGRSDLSVDAAATSGRGGAVTARISGTRRSTINGRASRTDACTST